MSRPFRPKNVKTPVHASGVRSVGRASFDLSTFFHPAALFLRIMAAILETCRDYIQRAYREKLGTEFSDSLSQLETGRQPVWRFVSAEDLTAGATPAERGVGALLDPEIGLLFYLARFESGTNLRQQIICAVALSSRLSIQARSAAEVGDAGDPRGSWRVVLHWLVDARDRQAWIKEVADVRRETAFSEDVSLDAVFLDPDEDVENQLERHGFPRLLLETRAVLRKQRPGDVTRWMSADDLVKAALAGFSSRFEKPEQRELADQIVQVMEQSANGAKPGPDVAEFHENSAKPLTLDRVRIENFRNLRGTILDFGPEQVSAEIIHGSNGTGKTSLCEAIALALFGSSSAYRAFSDKTREKDVGVTDRGREYVTRYLTPLGSASRSSGDTRPKVSLNEKPLVPLQLVAPSDTSNSEVAMDGTVLYQDTSLEFAKMPAQELGARILRGYSGLADQIEEIVENRVLQASTNRQDFLRTFGLSASITKVDTAFVRMARREIDRSLPGFPRPLVEWLDTTQVGAQLAWRWQEWGNESSRNALASRLSLLDTSPANLEVEIRTWLEEFNALAALSAEVVKNIDARIGPLRQELDMVVGRIKTWGEWLAGTKAASEVPSAERVGPDPQATSSANKLEALQAEQQRIIEQGRNAARHFEHLTQVEAYVRETWGRQEPNRCPTCGVDHAERGGILPVIQSWREQTTGERDRLRHEYSRLKAEIGDLQRSLADLGQGHCPISIGEQSRISEALRWLVSGQADFRQWITVKSQREEILATLSALKHVPIVPAAVNADDEAARVARELSWQFADARQIFEAPSNWKPVREKLIATLADIVNRHLPRTLGALWSELFLNLTPAPWLLPERPAIEIATKRGEQAATLQVKGRLARYILNQSEVHILGLGWFFSRYLTRGRFSHACVIMDDPACELDQPGFRDLCRLCESLLRLHRVYQRPFRLILTLNQETRAMEAARATGGVLLSLGWAPDQSNLPAPVRVIAEGLYPPQPVRLFQKVAS
jgi:hypothetical protein